jgi:hypothetical protein
MGNKSLNYKNKTIFKSKKMEKKIDWWLTHITNDDDTAFFQNLVDGKS